MIVTSFEYEKWQQEYANRASGTTQQAGSANEQNPSSSGQAFAAQLAVQQSSQQDSITDSKNAADTKQSAQENDQAKPSFGEEAFEYLLANRLGVDKRTLDELKAELEALEAERDSLIEKETLNEAQQQRLEVINERIDALSQLMQDLVEQASERAAEKEAQQALLSGAAIDSKDTQRPFGV